jgi:hypothetical protein
LKPAKRSVALLKIAFRARVKGLNIDFRYDCQEKQDPNAFCYGFEYYLIYFAAASARCWNGIQDRSVRGLH